MGVHALAAPLATAAARPADALYVDVTYYSYGSVWVSPSGVGVQGAPTYTPSAVQVAARSMQ